MTNVFGCEKIAKITKDKLSFHVRNNEGYKKSLIVKLTCRFTPSNPSNFNRLLGMADLASMRQPKPQLGYFYVIDSADIQRFS